MRRARACDVHTRAHELGLRFDFSPLTHYATLYLLLLLTPELRIPCSDSA